VYIRTDDMELAGDIVQELCDFLNVSELASTADFPHEFNALQTILAMVCYFCCWSIIQLCFLKYLSVSFQSMLRIMI